jgi:hypothetical protein
MGLAMAKRKNNVQRTDSGRASRASKHILNPVAPAALARHKDAVIAKLSESKFEGRLGYLCLSGQINSVLYEAGLRWYRVAAAYNLAIGVKAMKTANLEGGAGGTAADPDSEKGKHAALHDIAAVKLYQEARQALWNDGKETLRDVRDLVELNEYLEWSRTESAKRGLEALAVHWQLMRR